MNPTSLLAHLNPTPPAKDKHGKSSLPPEGTKDFTAALAALLGGTMSRIAHPSTPAAEGQGAPDPSAGATDPGASSLASGSLTAVLAGTPASAVAPGAAAPQTLVAGAAATGTPAASPVDPAMEAAVGQLVADSAATTAAVPATRAVRATPATAATPATPAKAGSPATPAVPATRATPASPATRGGAPDGAHRDTSAGRAEGQVPGASSDGTSVLDPALAGAGATTTVTATSSGSDDTVTTAVLRQVFPQVTQVATTPGTHRITITLHPESLGEVKVTVIVRAGGVHVRLAADASAAEGAQARQALLQGAPELHRLLESTAGDVRVVVQGSPSGRNQDPTQQSPGQGQSQNQGQNQSQGQAQSQTEAGDGQRRSSYQPGSPQNLPQAADLPIGGTTTTSARSAARPGQVDDHAGRLDRLM